VLANHKSAAKRARQTKKKTVVQMRTRSTVRTFEKKLRKAIEQKSGDEAQKLLVTFASKIDKATNKGVYHANTASRKVSRLAKQVQAL